MSKKTYALSELYWAITATTLTGIIFYTNVYVTYFIPNTPLDVFLASIVVPFWGIVHGISIYSLIESIIDYSCVTSKE